MEYAESKVMVSKEDYLLPRAEALENEEWKTRSTSVGGSGSFNFNLCE